MRLKFHLKYVDHLGLAFNGSIARSRETDRDWCTNLFNIRLQITLIFLIVQQLIYLGSYLPVDLL